MAYCYECGEQVAENDVFCPFCGISLTPIGVDGEQEDDSFSKTIVGKAPQTAAAQSPTTTDKPAAVSTGVAENQTPSAENREAESSQRISENNQNELDIPAPKILETLRPINELDENEKCSSKEKSFESSEKNAGVSEINTNDKSDSKPDFVSTEGEKIETEENEEMLAPDIQTESSLMSYEEAEIKEFESGDAPETSIDEESSDYSVANKEKIEFNPAANAIAIEIPISMPDAELPAEECPPSRFDSVSIMEKSETAEETPQEFEAKNLDADKSADEQPRSSTQQNIGGNDTDGKSKTKLKPLDEGTILNNRYEIIRKIGGGGMGAVYLASDKNLGGVLRAVKEMVQSYIEDEQQEKAINDFKRESMLLTSLDHQSIPTIFDYFFDETEARFYLVMKYISGGDLAGRLRSAPESRIDETSVTQWAIQIADVLDYLHNRQPPIVYRDLKPANIMVDGNSGRVMLIDFGIARWVNKEEKGVTAVGTMGYAPPELFSGNVEARSDIYSLGSTMFHLLTGADPQSNPLLIFDFQKHPRPRQINPQLSDQMERILMRSVEYNAEKRFASAAELRKALEEHLDNLKAGRATYGVKEAPISVSLADEPVFCGFCGQKIVANDMFCAFCGSKQPLAQEGVHAHSEGYAPAPLTAQLLIIGTNELEQPAFRLEKDDNLVGRRDPMSNIFPEVDLSKYDPQTKISRRHARIWRQGSEFMVEDLGSSNGTFILPVVSDTMRLQPHQPQLLTNGDKIKLGDTTLHFILG